MLCFRFNPNGLLKNDSSHRTFPYFKFKNSKAALEKFLDTSSTVIYFQIDASGRWWSKSAVDQMVEEWLDNHTMRYQKTVSLFGMLDIV